MAKRQHRAKEPAQKDLFGTPVKRRRSRLEDLLVKADRGTFEARLQRLKYIDSIAPKAYGMMASMETIAVFHEASIKFVNGAFAATVMLSQAFIEHWLQAFLTEKGFENEAKKGLKFIIKFYRDNHLLSEYLLDKIEHLRLVRNPFTHLKPYDHPFTMSQRLYLERKSPDELLENEAKDALGVMYSVFIARL